MTQAQQVLRDLLLDGDLTRLEVFEVLPFDLDALLAPRAPSGPSLRSAIQSLRLNPPEIDLDDLRRQLEADLAHQRSLLDRG